MANPAVIVARQPICDRDRAVHGYELRFRAHDRERALVVDDEQATAHVLITSLVDLGVRAVVGTRWAAINVSRTLLLELVPLPFGPQQLVIELLEDQLVDDLLVERCAQLVGHGYRLALDDFTYTPDADPLLRIATIVKLDVRQHGLDGVSAQMRQIRAAGYEGALLAEKVEDEAEFAACRQMGFDLFQGWFFCKPQLVEGRAASTSATNALRAAAELTVEDLSFEQLERIVSRDPGLTIRLLRLLNSAAFPTNRQIRTVHEALVMLGERTVRQWAMLIILAGLPASCDELLPTALIRARLLERLSAARGDASPDAAFIVGLFSVVDAMLGVTMGDILADLPLADEHLDALLRREGPNGRALGAVIAHEQGEPWATADVGVTAERFADAHLEAIDWARGCAPGLVAA
jgi:EAL and modified HD-GYP domain-containing signal transduction protein